MTLLTMFESYQTLALCLLGGGSLPEGCHRQLVIAYTQWAKEIKLKYLKVCFKNIFTIFKK